MKPNGLLGKLSQWTEAITIGAITGPKTSLNRSRDFLRLILRNPANGAAHGQGRHHRNLRSYGCWNGRVRSVGRNGGASDSDRRSPAISRQLVIWRLADSFDGALRRRMAV